MMPPFNHSEQPVVLLQPSTIGFSLEARWFTAPVGGYRVDITSCSKSCLIQHWVEELNKDLFRSLPIALARGFE